MNPPIDFAQWARHWETMSRDALAQATGGGGSAFAGADTRQWQAAQGEAMERLMAGAQGYLGMLQSLAAAGFQQSYTYFAWRNTKEELAEFLTGLSEETSSFLRPNLFVNTPDILTEYLQFGGRAAFHCEIDKPHLLPLSLLLAAFDKRLPRAGLIPAPVSSRARCAFLQHPRQAQPP